MKKALARIFLVVALAATPSATPSASLDKLPAVHLLPDNPLYFLKTLKEKAQLVVTRNAKDQADLLLGFSQERLAEAVKVAEKGKTHISGKLIEAYGEDIAKARAAIDNAKAAGEQTHNLLIKMKQTIEYQEAVLQRIEEGAKLIEGESGKIGTGWGIIERLTNLFGRREILKPL